VIRVRVEAGKKSHQVAGTLYHRKDPRIIEIDEFKVEVVDNHLLLILNEDRPGVIGTVGHILGDHNINIARMQCSREERGGKALLIFGLDAPLPAPVLEQITNSKHILSVKVADLSKGL
jgi:D-3-phosphoglycerate dehydrogenase